MRRWPLSWKVLARPVAAGMVAAALVAGCVNGPRVRGPSLAEAGVAPLPEDQGRIYFYGKNIGLRGFPSVGIWRPNVTIDGTPLIPAVHAHGVVFYVDRSPGEYLIGVDNDVREKDREPPSDYEGQSLALAVGAGRVYYVKMIPHGSNAPLVGEPSQHYLELKLVPDVLGSVEIRRFELLTATEGG